MRTIQATDPDVALSVRWRPFFLDPTIPKGGMVKMERYIAKFGEARVRQMLPFMQETGRRDGINFDYGGRISNTLNSHRIIEAAWEQGGAKLQDRVVEELFKFYFEKQGDLGDDAALAAVAATAGMDGEEVTSMLASDKYTSSVIEAARGLPAKFRVSGVPFFIFASGKTTVSGGQEAKYFESVLRSLLEDLE